MAWRTAGRGTAVAEAAAVSRDRYQKSRRDAVHFCVVCLVLVLDGVVCVCVDGFFCGSCTSSSSSHTFVLRTEYIVFQGPSRFTSCLCWSKLSVVVVVVLLL